MHLEAEVDVMQLGVVEENDLVEVCVGGIGGPSFDDQFFIKSQTIAQYRAFRI